MAKELIYTSVPEGLKAASSGFCTVAVTAGLSKPAVLKLEMISGYRFAFDLSDSNVEDNPDNFAFTSLSIAGERYYVLSRIAYCGADYSGRINKIAHHFLLSKNEQLMAGPASMALQMSKIGIFKSKWDKPPAELASIDLINSLQANERVSVLTSWQEIAGDAGWAGKLAEAYYKDSQVPSFLLYSPGMSILSLFHEAMSIIPEQDRWKISFSTYYSQGTSESFCNWRGILKGSDAERECLKYPGALVIDLTKTQSELSESNFINAARNARVIEFPKPAAQAKPEGEKRFADVEKHSVPPKKEVADRAPFSPKAGMVKFDVPVRSQSKSKNYVLITVLALFSFGMTGGLFWYLLNSEERNTSELLTSFEAEQEASEVDNIIDIVEPKDDLAQEDVAETEKANIDIAEANQVVSSNLEIETLEEPKEILPEFKFEFCNDDLALYKKKRVYSSDPNNLDGMFYIGKSTCFRNTVDEKDLQYKIKGEQLIISLPDKVYGFVNDYIEVARFTIVDIANNRYLKVGDYDKKYNQLCKGIVVEAVDVIDEKVYQCRNATPLSVVCYYPNKIESEFDPNDYRVSNTYMSKFPVTDTSILVIVEDIEYEFIFDVDNLEFESCFGFDELKKQINKIKVAHKQGIIDDDIYKKKIAEKSNEYKGIFNALKSDNMTTICDMWGLPLITVTLKLDDSDTSVVN